MNWRRTSGWLIPVGLLLATGCTCGLSPRPEQVALTEAAARGDARAVASFLADGGSPGFSYWRPEGGRLGSSVRLLGAAVESGSWETVELLVQQPEYRDQALGDALLRHQLEIATRLIDQGAKVPAQASSSLVVKIINRAEHVPTPEGTVLRALQLMSRAGFTFSANDLQATLRTLYLASPRSGRSFVQGVTELELQQAARFLMDATPDVTGHPTLISLAIRAQQREVALELIRAGASVQGSTDPQAQDVPPLTAAIEADDPALVSALLSAGADPAQPDRPGPYGKNAVQLATSSKRTALLPLLCSASPTLCAQPPR